MLHFMGVLKRRQLHDQGMEAVRQLFTLVVSWNILPSVSEKSVVSQEIKNKTKWDSTAETNMNNLPKRKTTEYLSIKKIYMHNYSF